LETRLVACAVVTELSNRPEAALIVFEGWRSIRRRTRKDSD
jgi:hypothetical protein